MTKITTSNLDNTINTKLAAGESASAAVANIVSLAISSVQIANSSYDVLDDTAANTSGGYLVINGTGFTNQSFVIVGMTNATSTTFANTKQLRAQVPGLAASSYPLYVVDNVTGATAIKVNGLTYSSFPAWSTGSTLSNQAANTAFSVSLSANSDSSITYANTTALPAGTTLAANGYFSGTVSIGNQTTFSFDVKATDAELQDANRTFQVTVTVIPQIRLYSWGLNNSGELGLNNTVTKSSPTQIGTNTDWSSTGTGCGVIKTDGTLWIWGSNSFGQLGLNNTVNKSSPTQVGSTTNWSKVSNGSGLVFMAVKTDGTLWCWGRDFRGGLGLTNSVNISKSSPTQIGTGTNWSNVILGEGRTFAIKTDGTLWTWGSTNQHGEAGLNSTLPYGHGISSPTQVGSSYWAAVTPGEECSYGIRTDGTLWAWGRNNNGESGLNETIMRSSPTQIGSGTTWSSILELHSGGRLAGAIKTDGTLWTWGANDQGQSGHNDRVNKSSPTQVAGATWLKVALSYKTAIFGTKTDGTLWSWGQNHQGQLGQNDTVNRSSPVQIGTGTTWSNVFEGIGTVLAQTSN